MCRPIESRDSLAGIAPTALFAGYAPQGNKFFLGDAIASPALKGQNNGLLNTTTSTLPWSPSMSSLGFGSNENMIAIPPQLPFVSSSFPKNLPWINEDVNAPFMEERMAPSTLMDTTPQILTKEEVDAAELEELLDFSLPEDNGTEKDKEDLLNLDDGFDGTEMSILYSFLADAPEEKIKEENIDITDDGLLNLNLLAASPIDSFIESFDGVTDEEFKFPAPATEQINVKAGGEVKSRRLCKAEGCYKRSRSNGLCISHGGGRRCAVEGCDKSSQGGNLCIRHGGGKRCSHEGCDKAAQSNFLCKAHGGGPRCQFENCNRSSQGGGYCRSHGGGKRCMFDGCTKGTQRGDYCALHGGSRLCEIPGCMRNDRGGGLCATHGGGKRCNINGCIKPCRRKGLCSAHLRQMEHAK
jgi:hypothetical protein